jgi:hypothetical protein
MRLPGLASDHCHYATTKFRSHVDCRRPVRAVAEMLTSVSGSLRQSSFFGIGAGLTLEASTSTWSCARRIIARSSSGLAIWRTTLSPAPRRWGMLTPGTPQCVTLGHVQ